MTLEKSIEFGKIFLKTIEDEKGSATYEFVEMAVKMMEKEPCQDIKEYYKDIWECDINHPLYEDTVAEIVEKSYISGYVHGVENTAKEFRFELEQEPCEMTAEEYRQRMIQAFHNVDCDELIAVCVLPTEKEFEHLEWLLKNHYKKEPCEDVMAIHTQGLAEGIRCAMCTNSLKSDRGCDGGCVVNEDMHKEVMNTIKNHIIPPTNSKMEQVEDVISRDELLKAIDTWDKFGCDADTKLVPYQDHYIPYIHYDDVVKCIKGMPSITPQPKMGHWIDKFGGVYRCSCCREIISIDTEIEHPNGITYKYCPNCGCRMSEGSE